MSLDGPDKAKELGLDGHGRAEVGLNGIHLNSVQAIRHRRTYYAQLLRSMQFQNQYTTLGTRKSKIKTLKLYSNSTSKSKSRSFPPLPHLCSHRSQQCASTPSDGFVQCCCHAMQVSRPACYSKWVAQDGISLALRIVCLACSRSCCFVLPCPVPRSLHRPKQALDATHRHYYSYMRCLFWQRINASILLCYSTCRRMYL